MPGTVQDDSLRESEARQVLALLEAEAPRDCAALGTLSVQLARLTADFATARDRGDRLGAAAIQALISTLEVEIVLAMDALADRNARIDRLRSAA